MVHFSSSYTSKLASKQTNIDLLDNKKAAINIH